MAKTEGSDNKISRQWHGMVGMSVCRFASLQIRRVFGVVVGLRDKRIWREEVQLQVGETRMMITRLEMDSTPSTLTTKTACRFFTNEEVCITCTRHGRVRRRVVLVVECVQRQDTTCAERDSRGAFGAKPGRSGVLET